MSTHLIGKSLYITADNKSYRITGVTDQTTFYRLTVTGGPITQNETSLELPARIIDSSVEYYKLQFKSEDAVGRAIKEVININLGPEFVTSPSHVTKLELGKSWNATIQAVNNYAFSPIVTMPSGSFDPDQSTGGQSVRSYGSPFYMSLPFITSTGTVDIEATTSGFDVNMGGWTAGDNYHVRSHELEILWSSKDNITSSTFDQIPLPDSVQRLVTKSPKASITSPVPTSYKVAVRPLQNKQGVAIPIIKTISSGGGGVVPEEQILFNGPIDIRTTKFQVDSKVGSTYMCRAFNPVTDLFELVPESIIANKLATFPTSTNLTPTSFSSGTFQNTDSTTSVVITPSVVAKGTPDPGVLKFTAATKASNASSKTDEPK